MQRLMLLKASEALPLGLRNLSNEANPWWIWSRLGQS